MTRHCNTHTAAVVFWLFTSLLFFACSRHDGRFRLEGQFKNLNQGEFFLYSLDRGTKDTIAVNDGRFVYERLLRDTLTLVMLFPNYSELPVFALPNTSVKMEGDVTHLRKTTITGSDENNLMTTFRTKTADMVPPDVKKEAQAFIDEHPASIVSVYLLRRYFLQDASPDYPLIMKMATALHEAQPQNQPLTRLHLMLGQLVNNRSEGPLPAFQAISTKGDTITNSSLKKDANVIVAWATWSYESQGALRQLKNLRKEHSNLAVMSICLDASPAEGLKLLERDSINWPNICDSMLWQSPLLGQLGICTLPANILTDQKGNIVARDINDRQLKEEIEKLLAK